MTKRKGWAFAALLASLVMLAAACSDVKDTGSSASASTSGGAKPDCGSDTVKIAVNPWTGSAVNANVAKAIMEKDLGCTVELVEVDEFAQFPALSTGDLDATLEVWPSGHAKDVKKYIDGGQGVVNGGLLGVIGQIGWFVPTYMVDAHPELATWEGLNQNAALFATAETGSQGQFLDGDPSFVTFDQAIIDSLHLNFKVVYAGSEAAEITALKQADANEGPLLFYFYTPHWAQLKYKLTHVQLPPVTPKCDEIRGRDDYTGYDCDYPTDVLFKAFNADLETKAPAAFQFLSNMNWTNEAQEAVATDIDVNKMSPADAAQKWVDANPTVWQPWVPTS
jgi:glycine betaine/proline transport system substrate-binding protein